MTVLEIREKYLNFWTNKGHKLVPSSSLVPKDDATTLFISSGMQPIIPYLLGENHPSGDKIVDSQKCFRTEDIDEVGDNRHTTFFEMLGNWSFGSYWKEDQLTWLWEFLTKELGLAPEKLYVTVFGGDKSTGFEKDEESVLIWQKLFTESNISAGVADCTDSAVDFNSNNGNNRIFYYGAKKNWWSRSGVPENMPIGEPGGPDSEVFYDFGEFSPTGEKKHTDEYGKYCHLNCDCGRFVEIGNSVFMEFKKIGDNNFENLVRKNVDFGGGLERLAMAVNNYNDIFEIDVFSSVIKDLENLSGLIYSDCSAVEKKAFRVIADHIRGIVFMISEGIKPSNTDRGYILRRLLRRVVRFADVLNIEKNNIANLSTSVIQKYKDIYPEVLSAEKFINSEITAEEEKFRITLAKGISEFEKLVANGSKSISGHDAFILFTTYGFPIEMTEELALEHKMSIDKDNFSKEMIEHQDLSRTAAAGRFKGGLSDTSEKVVRLHTATHLMNAALRKILGNMVYQKGSNITDQRTRFDFTYPDKMTKEEISEVENLVNSWISRDLTVRRDVMSREDAEKLGAIGVFGEKYPDNVSIYSIIDEGTEELISREFCGGPHVEHTGVIGKFSITKEESSSAGVRRIKAIIE